MPRLQTAFYALVFAGAVLTLSTAGCDLDVTNPNAASEEQVLTTAEGIRALAVGMQNYYATETLEPVILTTGVSAREAGVVTTLENLTRLERGAVDFNSANVLQLWSRNYRVIAMAEDLIANAPEVTLAPGTESGIVALAHLYKAMALGNLAQNFEQAPLQTSEDNDALFVPRQEVLAEAVRLLDEAGQLIAATPPSAEFTGEVLGSGFDLASTIDAYRARYNLFAGNYDAALAAADAVDPSATSLFVYSDQAQNPIHVLVYDLEYYAPRDQLGLTDAEVAAGDARLDFWLDPREATSSAGYPVDSLQGFFAEPVSSIPAFIPDEMALIRAEAHVRQGNLEAAVEAVNAVRTQAPSEAPLGVGAGLEPYSGPATAEALLEEIYEQRRAELFLQGLALEDSRRLLDVAPQPNAPFVRTLNYYPYPQQECLNNPNTPDCPAS